MSNERFLRAVAEHEAAQVEPAEAAVEGAQRKVEKAKADLDTAKESLAAAKDALAEQKDRAKAAAADAEGLEGGTNGNVVNAHAETATIQGEAS